MITDEIRAIFEATNREYTFSEAKEIIDDLKDECLFTVEVTNIIDAISLIRDEIDLDPFTLSELISNVQASDTFEMSEGRREYLFVSESSIESEAYDRARVCLEECVLIELEGAARQYFDEEQWIQDYIDQDGYGSVFNTYDGDYDEVGNWYLFRMN